VKNLILLCFVVIVVGGIFLLAGLVPFENEIYEGYSEKDLPLWNDRPFEYTNTSVKVYLMGMVLRINASQPGVLECSLTDISSGIGCGFDVKNITFLVPRGGDPD